MANKVDKTGYSYKTTPSGLRYATVDLGRVLLAPLWEHSGYPNCTDLSHFTDFAKEVGDPPSPKYDRTSPYVGLSLVCNGTFNFGVAGPGGHLVGFRRANTTFSRREAYGWSVPTQMTSPPDPEKRWYFAICSRGSTGTGPVSVEFDKGSALQGGQSQWLSDYLTLLHGGMLLYDNALDPGVPTATYVTDFNNINDQVQSMDAYSGLGGGSANRRWGIAQVNATTIIIASTKSMTIHDFAVELRQAAGGASSGIGIMFDGGGHHGWQACDGDGWGNIYDFNADPKQDKGKNTFCHFGVFQFRNIALRRFGYKRVPERHGMVDAPLSVLTRDPPGPLDLKFLVMSSRYTSGLRETKDLKLTVIQRKFFDLGVWPPSSAGVAPLERTWGKQLPIGRNLTWPLPKADAKQVLDMSKTHPEGLVCVLHGLDDAGDRIGTEAVPLQLSTGIDIAFLADASSALTANPAAAKALVAARNAAVTAVGISALKKAALSPSLGDFVGYPTALALVGYDKTAQTLLTWSDKLGALRQSVKILPGNSVTPPDYRRAFNAVENLFQQPGSGATKRKRVFFFAAGKHTAPGQTAFDVSLLNAFEAYGITVHCIGTGNADAGELKAIAEKTGGTWQLVTPDKVLAAFNKAYAEDNDEEVIRQISGPLAAGASLQDRFKIASNGAITIQIHVDGGIASSLVVELNPPGAAPVSSSDPRVRYVVEPELALLIVPDPSRITTHSGVWTVTIKRPRAERDAPLVDVTVTQQSSDDFLEGAIIFASAKVPGRTMAGRPMPVSASFDPDALLPDRVELHARMAEAPAFTRYVLTPADGGRRWDGSVPAGAFTPGEAVSFLLARSGSLEAAYPQGAPDQLFRTKVLKGPEDIVFARGDVPSEAFEGQTLAVEARTQDSSPRPSAVSIHARPAGNGAFSEFALHASDDGPIWQGAIPGSHVRPGTLESYFRAVGDNAVGCYPPEAPDRLLTTAVAEATPIVLQQGHIPALAAACKGLRVLIEVAAGSPQPENVTINIARRAEPACFTFDCRQVATNRWEGFVPPALMLPGEIGSFFAAAGAEPGVSPGRWPGEGASVTRLKLGEAWPLYLTDMRVPQSVRAGEPLEVSVRLRKPTHPPALLVFRGRNIEAKTVIECRLSRQTDGSWRGAVPGEQVLTGTLLGHFFAQINAKLVAIAPDSPHMSEYRTDIRP
ncbi:MAG: hypothetical protein Tsb0019_34810 [Roseibium sp.]